MKVIVPQFVGGDGFGDITMAELLTSSVAESSEATWAVGTTYALGAVVKYQLTTGNEKGIYKTYSSLEAGNVGNIPESAAAKWTEIGPTERWKMFDYYIMTATTDAAANIVVDLHCRSIDTVCFMGVQAASVTTKVYKGSESADKVPANLLQTLTTDLTQKIFGWGEYFFADFDYVRDVAIPVEISLYHNVVLEITFTKITGEDCYVGQCLPGRAYSLGATRYGVATGIQDYSRKITDPDFGYTYLSQGNYKKLIDANLIILNENMNSVNMVLTQLRAVPTVWQFNSTGTEYDNLLAYGFAGKFTIVMSHPTFSECSLAIESLI